MNENKRIDWRVVIAGIMVGLAALALTLGGNPANMGLCIACFLRDSAGALGLHGAANVQYLRPEIIGLVLGAFLSARGFREWRAQGGSSPALRFVLGALVMLGALMFLGCPLRMVLRIGGGDWNALVGLAGFAAGVAVGALFLKRGFTLRRAYPLPSAEGGVLPVAVTAGLFLLLLAPSMLRASTEGPGAKHAVWYLALGAGILIGVAAQRSRLCMVGGLRDVMLFGDFKLLYGFVAIFITVLIGNLALGSFHPGFAGQSIAHTDGLWNFLGMALAGWGCVLLSGCPLRQLILAGEGNSDSAVTVLGMLFGAALCHNFGLASSGEGPTAYGKLAVGIGFVLLLVISIANLPKED